MYAAPLSERSSLVIMMVKLLLRVVKNSPKGTFIYEATRR